MEEAIFFTVEEKVRKLANIIKSDAEQVDARFSS